MFLGDNSNLKAAISDSESALGKINGVGKAAFKGVAAAGAGAAAGLGASAKKFVDFESAMAEVATLGDFTKEELEAMKDEVLGLSTELGASGGAAGVAAGMYQTLSAGFGDAESSSKILEQSIKAAKAGITDTDVAVDSLTTVLNAYGKGADEAEGVSDVFFETVKRGKTTFPEMASAIGRVTAIAPAMGVSFEEIGAATATLTASGINTDQTMTALSAVMRSFMKPSSDMSAKLKELGFESGNAAIEALGFQGALEAVTEGADQTEMGKLFADTEALKGVMPLVGSQAEKFSENLEGMSESAGGTEKAFETMEETTAAKMDKMKNKIEAGMIEIGGPVIEALSAIGEAFAEAFGGDSEGAIETIVGAVEDATPHLENMASAAGEIARFMAENTWVMKIAAGVIGILAGLYVIFTVATWAQVAASAALFLVTSPISLIILAIVLAVVQAIVIFKNWGAITDWISGKWEEFKDFAVKLWDSIMDFFEHWFRIAVNLFKFQVDTIKAIFTAAWEFISETAVAAWEGIKDFFAGFFADLIGLFQGWIDTIVGIADAAWEGLKDALSGIIEWFGDVAETVADFFVGIAEDAWQWGKDILDGIWDGIKAGWDAFSGWFEDRWDDLIGGFKDVFGIASRSKVMFGFGLNMVEGIEDAVATMDRGLLAGLGKDLVANLDSAAIPSSLDLVAGFDDTSFRRGGGGFDSGASVVHHHHGDTHYHIRSSDPKGVRREIEEHEEDRRRESGGMRPGG